MKKQNKKASMGKKDNKKNFVGKKNTAKAGTKTNNKKIAVYAGSFDPVTNGHINVLERASELFDEIIIAVGTHHEKKTLFSLNERVSMIKIATKDMKNIKVDSFSGLLVDYMDKKNVKFVLRGLRALSDFEAEFQSAVTNRKLNPDIDSVFVMTSAEYFFLSSSLVKEVGSLKGDVSNFVPKNVESALKKKFMPK
ncbi:MAG: pantetheine-phosphate adenylyltransferase [Candidatus Diapherotrites archaeon]